MPIIFHLYITVFARFLLKLAQCIYFATSHLHFFYSQILTTVHLHYLKMSFIFFHHVHKCIIHTVFRCHPKLYQSVLSKNMKNILAKNHNLLYFEKSVHGSSTSLVSMAHFVLFWQWWNNGMSYKGMTMILHVTEHYSKDLAMSSNRDFSLICLETNFHCLPTEEEILPFDSDVDVLLI